MSKTYDFRTAGRLAKLMGTDTEAQIRDQREFFVLAEQFRSATEREQIKHFGDKLGRMIFGFSIKDTKGELP